MKIYVGNLAFDVKQADLETEFGAFGKVESVAIISDKFTGRPKGFAFVEMPLKTEAEAAIAGLNGITLNDRAIVVNVSRPREENKSGSGSYGNRKGGGYGGGYGRNRGGRSSGRQRRY